MRDYTLENPRKRDLKKRRRTQILDMIIAIILFALAVVVILSAADWASTMNGTSLAICLTALVGGLAIAIYLNIREEHR